MAWRPALALGCVIPLAVGCAAAPKPRLDPFVLAVRYDVIPAWIGVESGSPLDVSREHFVRIAEWGFDTAVLQHVADEDRLALLALAQECGLRLAVPDRTIDDFVSTGVWPTAATPTASELAQRLRPIAAHPAFAAVVLAGTRGDEPCARRLRVRQLLWARGLPVIALDGKTGCGSGASAPALVNTGELWDGPAGDAPRRLLVQYFDALRDGRTAGLVVDRFARLPRDAPESGNPSPDLAAHRTALAELISRAKRWGPLLAAAEPVALPWPNDKADEVNLTLFQRGERRYLLIANATARFVRRELSLPQAAMGAPLNRAVEVPSRSEQGAGSVVHVRGHDLTVPVTLRPGDATLYELF